MSLPYNISTVDVIVCTGRKFYSPARLDPWYIGPIPARPVFNIQILDSARPRPLQAKPGPVLLNFWNFRTFTYMTTFNFIAQLSAPVRRWDRLSLFLVWYWSPGGLLATHTAINWRFSSWSSRKVVVLARCPVYSCGQLWTFSCHSCGCNLSPEFNPIHSHTR